jgi:hypothetical protein
MLVIEKVHSNETQEKTSSAITLATPDSNKEVRAVNFNEVSAGKVTQKS